MLLSEIQFWHTNKNKQWLKNQNVIIETLMKYSSYMGSSNSILPTLTTELVVVGYLTYTSPFYL